MTFDREDEVEEAIARQQADIIDEEGFVIVTRLEAAIQPVQRIHRAEFQAAIEAGIAADADNHGQLQPDDQIALREVGRTAQVVGNNFDACPLTKAGLYHGDGTDACYTFAFAYDDYLYKVIGVSSHQGSGNIENFLRIVDA